MNIENLKKFFKNDRFAALAGIEIVEVSTGYCKARMVIEDKHLNAANIVQGGAIFTLADFAFGLASNSHGQLALAINVSITFLKGKPSGVLYATAREVANPKRIGAYNVEVTDENGEVVACFSGLAYRKNEMINE